MRGENNLRARGLQLLGRRDHRVLVVTCRHEAASARIVLDLFEKRACRCRPACRTRRARCRQTRHIRRGRRDRDDRRSSSRHSGDSARSRGRSAKAGRRQCRRRQSVRGLASAQQRLIKWLVARPHKPHDCGTHTHDRDDLEPARPPLRSARRELARAVVTATVTDLHATSFPLDAIC